MKNRACIISFVLLICTLSCTTKDEIGKPVADPARIASDFTGWLNYQYKHVKLFQHFVGYDTNSRVMDRGAFIQEIASGGFLPLRLNSNDSLPHYKLYKMNSDVNKDVFATVKNYGKIEYAHYQMEGKALPGLNFVDLNGKVFDHKTTKNKIIVLKCWFIKCTNCVLEMPELNKMVKKYENRDDVVFVSLAFDSASELKNFLARRKFDYAVVANQEKYMLDELKINMYPSHLIIGKDGLIKMVVNSAQDLIPEVARIVSK